MAMYGDVIANAALEIGAIKLWPKEGPFLGESGTMPIYNDNRKFLSAKRFRIFIAADMECTIEDENLKPDLIAGTSTAGIAPAASLAQLLKIPVVIQHEGKAYVFDEHVLDSLSVLEGLTAEHHILVSTCPFAIPTAVFDANRAEMPFAYVRQSPEGHGPKKQIEGVVTRGQDAFVVDYHLGSSYKAAALEALVAEGVTAGYVISDDARDVIKPADVRGKRILQVEDLVFTGGSCVDEIRRYRELGAEVTDCLAIFSYGLDAAVKSFSDAGVALRPVLMYDRLITLAIAKGLVPQESIAALREWRLDPFNWGERHGFPPKKKD